MLRHSIIASLAAAVLAQAPAWVSTNYYSGATCTGTPTGGHVDTPLVWAVANAGLGQNGMVFGNQHLTCTSDNTLGGAPYSMLTCSGGIAQVLRYSDSACTTPVTTAPLADVPSCTPNAPTYGTYGQTCGTGAYPTSGAGLGLSGNYIVAGYAVAACGVANTGYVFSQVSAFGTCQPFSFNGVNIAVQATCSGGVLTGNYWMGTTCPATGSIAISAGCMPISGAAVTLSCTTPPAKSGSTGVVASVTAAVAAGAAVFALAA